MMRAMASEQPYLQLDRSSRTDLSRFPLRDPFMIQFWMFATPVVYPREPGTCRLGGQPEKKPPDFSMSHRLTQWPRTRMRSS